MTATGAGNPFEEAPVIIGHRGAAGLVPENTLPSFARAVALDVQAVELDVHCCENELVVIHDPTVDRTTGSRGTVSRMTLAELRALDAGGGARIPTLSEVFDLLPRHIGINIELKGTGTAELLARWLPREPDRAVLLSSFHHGTLRAFRALRDDYPLAPLFGRWESRAFATAAEFESGYINLGRKLVTADRMRRISEAGLRALVYTVNDPVDAGQLISMGVWGLFTDFPDRVCRRALADAGRV